MLLVDIDASFVLPQVTRTGKLVGTAQ